MLDLLINNLNDNHIKYEFTSPTSIMVGKFLISVYNQSYYLYYNRHTTIFSVNSDVIVFIKSKIMKKPEYLK